MDFRLYRAIGGAFTIWVNQTDSSQLFSFIIYCASQEGIRNPLRLADSERTTTPVSPTTSCRV